MNAPHNEQADIAVEFINNLTLTGDYDGQPFVLRPWQELIVRKLFGTLDEKGQRLIQKAFFLIPRGNAKTELAAAMVIYCLVMHPKGGEIYSFASDREQAACIFNSAKSMVENDEWLSSFIEVRASTKRLIIPERHSFYSALSSETAGKKSKAGLKPSVVIAEELHAIDSGGQLYNTLTTAMSKRKNPLWISVSTAGRADPHHVCFQEFEYARQVEEGIIDDPTYLPVLYWSDHEKEDWMDEEVWFKCNPALGDFKNIDVVRKEFEIAKAIPSRQVDFRRDHLNQWLSSDSKWMDMATWDLCKGDVDADELTDCECIAGLDLAPVNDLSSLSLLFRIDDKWKTLTYVWCNENDIDRRSTLDKVPYRMWADQNLIKIMPGGTTQFDLIREDILELSHKFRIKTIAADKAHAFQLAQQLQEDGIDIQWHRQGAMDMNAPTLELEKRIIDKSLEHGGHPILRWCASNVVTEHNSTGLVRPVKHKSTERIDCVVSLIFATALSMADDLETESYWQNHKAIIV